jgi:hypothetical protein
MPKTTPTEGKAAVAVEKSTAALPFIIHFFMVQGIGFRCTAYCDQQGTWRDALKNEELHGDVRILE